MVRAKNRSKWAMISQQRELPSKNILVKLAHSKHDAQCFTFNLSLVCFGFAQTPQSKCDRLLLTIRHDVRQDSSHTIWGSVAGQLNQNSRVKMREGLFRSFECLLTFSGPPPTIFMTTICAEVSAG